MLIVSIYALSLTAGAAIVLLGLVSFFSAHFPTFLLQTLQTTASKSSRVSESNIVHRASPAVRMMTGRPSR